MAEAADIIRAKLSNFPDHGARDGAAVYKITGAELGMILDELEARPPVADAGSADHIADAGNMVTAGAVGEAGPMPGSNGGFTMAVFMASDIPEGTKLFAAPPALGGWKPDREAVARIVDPRAWSGRDQYLFAVEDLIKSGTCSADAVTDTANRRDGIVASLAKADDILALPPIAAAPKAEEA
jgi:hypothetical protein